MVCDMIFGVAGGLGLFLFGMVQMSEGLKKAAGQLSAVLSARESRL
jgi:Na+/phosphate symporter